ncbi:hypothetical protein PtA15_12A80 [Puccinia triticina]|uniref:Nascent polypeptide-associated complex subunit alpha-like UBA domain-containing protein n=1 Tax=Puccinia triticina TaxID=208348 RepID=A0ABY7D264_9BASI|nr:uncharacterized protein PtA15_12A80 [Puccinia triticina]WAQ90095.1 hypothetical protein PtA15_12A80 [Puccinia triticina]
MHRRKLGVYAGLRLPSLSIWWCAPRICSDLEQRENGTVRSPTRGASAAIHPDLDGAARDEELTPIIPMLRSKNEDSNPGPNNSGDVPDKPEDSNPGPDNAGDVPDGPENHRSEPTPDETPLQQEAMSVEQLADELGLDVGQIERVRRVAALSEADRVLATLMYLKSIRAQVKPSGTQRGPEHVPAPVHIPPVDVNPSRGFIYHRDVRVRQPTQD